MSFHDDLMAVAAEMAAAGETSGMDCPDAVNPAMIRNWTQAIGETGDWSSLAPPTMIQVWSMQGLDKPKGGSVAEKPLRMLNDNGFTGVVAVNCDQVYDRYLKVGEPIRSSMRFGEVVGPKKTALGEGYFLTWYQNFYDASGDRVAQMLFRVLKFQPRKGSRKSGSGSGKYPLQPAKGLDTAYFWEGIDAGELRIQKCADCGVLRHPPGPMCPSCHSTDRTHVAAAGTGTVYSYVVHHHPPVPGRTPPFVVAVVDLPEGVRIVGNVIDCDPAEVRIGMPVELAFQQMDDELTLPQWRPAGKPLPIVEPVASTAADPGLGEIVVPLTPTFVIASALATRDFTPVHHDVAIAQRQGSKDIFVNILTSMGLVQRYVTEKVPGATLTAMKVRLGAPAYAGDTLTLTGRRVDEQTVEVRGTVSLGAHVTATVTLGEAQ